MEENQNSNFSIARLISLIIPIAYIIFILVENGGLPFIGTKYCAAPGCPKEVENKKFDYCYSHKCYNHSCPNLKAYIKTKDNKLEFISKYCPKCLKRTNSK